MKFDKFKNKTGKLKVFDNIRSFKVKRVFAIYIKKSQIRANHGHKKQNQILLIFSGKIKITYFDIKTINTKNKVTLKEGEFFQMKKNIHIKIEAIKNSQIIILSDQIYDKKDYFTENDLLK